MRKILIIISVSLLSAVAGGWVAVQLSQPNEQDKAKPISMEGGTYYPASYEEIDFEKFPEATDNFVLASSKTTSSVVFVQTVSEYEYRTGSWLDWFFNDRPSQQTSTGSGVIVSSDGYIVTNNHVIDNADQIRVISGKKSYEAELMGRDPSTDLAVIKIDEKELPAIE